MGKIPLKEFNVPGRPNTYTFAQEAEAFSDVASYSIGDYVYYIGNNLYRCIVPHSGIWNGAHFARVLITDDLKTKASKDEVALKANRAEVEAALRNKQDLLTFDDAPQAGSQNPVTSAGIKSLADGLDISKADNLYYDQDTHLLYLTSNGEIISDGIEITGGGGGGGATYIVTLRSNMPSRSISVSEGMPVYLSVTYTSVDSEGQDDGNGVCSVIINGVTMLSSSIPQGENIIDITNVLSTGSNTVRIKVENSESTSRVLQFSVTVLALSISSTFNTFDIYNGDVTFYYTVIGTGTKTIHFLMDGDEIGTEEVTTSGRSQSYLIEKPDDGSHIFEVYATIAYEGVTVESNKLKFGMIWPNVLDPSIVSDFAIDSVVEGTTLSINYLVYDPQNAVANVDLIVILEGGQIYSSNSITVDQTPHTWNISDYPSGETTFKIVCRTETFEKIVEVEPYELPVHVVTDSLLMEFKATGRSNYEENPAQWSDRGYEGTFTGFGWNNVDGWLSDENYASMLRFIPGDYLYIPIMPFATDARSTGYTIEVELATRDVRNYDSVVFSCINNGRGFKIQSQEAFLNSEQSSVSMLFKEDSKVRVTFVIEQINLNRFVYIYINAVMCGIMQYPQNDDFSQPSPVGFTIGADSCGIDLYSIRCYQKGLNRKEQLDNYIADLPTLSERIDSYEKNNILNIEDEVTVSMLPVNLPYMIVSCPELPQFKGDKKTGVSVSYVDQINQSKSFEATGVEMDVQGTSSAGYPVKNEKLKFKNGFTINGSHADGYSLFSDSIPTNVFTFKCDFASSEGANNIELVMLYEENDPYKDPPQQEDPRVRKGMQGKPIAMFWRNTNTGKVTFLGKFNFNNDKGSPEVFGFTDEYPLAECWEFLNNTSNRTLFKSANYSGDDWKNDFESRYPEDYFDITNFARMATWVANHNRENASTDAEKEEMLEDFKENFENYFIKDPMIFYYIFTEVFLLVDSRAKNLFLTTFDGTHWFPFQYDMDTAIGINNEGALAFTYSLEDTDKVGGANVFNGQESVLWCNIRDAFGDEIATMYKQLRTKSGTSFSYESVRDRFLAHQSVWPEALWNEDAFIKYLQPYLLKGENYLSMLQGSKESQRDWWLFNAFRYRDSKYQTGDANNHVITLRCYGMGDITLIPYSDLYVRVKYGSYTVTDRAFRNNEITLLNPIDTMDDTEVYIYSADRISSIGDLSALNVGFADFSYAVKLQELKLGSDAVGYTNTKLTELNIGHNELLTELDIQNCINLSQTVDLSGCTGIETVLAGNTNIPSVLLPNGGHLKTLKLPESITNLTIQNQNSLETFECADYSNISTLRIENTESIPYEELINEASSLNRVRLIGFEWESEGEEELQSAIDRLNTCIGMDASGNNTPHAVLNGTIIVDDISPELLEEIFTNFPEVTVTSGGIVYHLVSFLGYDSSVLYSEIVLEGDDAEDPVVEGYIDTPTKPNTEEVHYVYSGWNGDLTNVHENMRITPIFSESYRVRFCNYDESILQTDYIAYGGTAVYSGATPTKPSTEQYQYIFTGWNRVLTNITEPTDLVAQYQQSVRYYTVRFFNGNSLLETKSVAYGGTVTYAGPTPVYPGPGSADDYDFSGWDKDTTSIHSDLDVYAVWIYNKSITRQYILSRSTINSITNSEISYIGPYAFYQFRYLYSVSFESCISIDRDAFRYCYELNSISFPLCKTLGSGAFTSCSGLQTIDFPNCEFIGSIAFNGCSNLSSVNFPSCSVLNSGAFKNCKKLNSISFPSCEIINQEAFSGCTSIQTVNFPMCEKIENNAFYSCTSLQVISFPNCKSIGYGAFQNCSALQTVIFPNCEIISNYAFAKCNNLTTISFASCKLIGSSYTFSGCSNLISIYFLGSIVPSLSRYEVAFFGTQFNSAETSAKFIVPESMIEKYRVTSPWSTQMGRFSIYNGTD